MKIVGQIEIMAPYGKEVEAINKEIKKKKIDADDIINISMHGVKGSFYIRIFYRKED